MSVNQMSQTKLSWEADKDMTVYMRLKRDFKEIPIAFHLQRLEREYENIHNSVKKH